MGTGYFYTPPLTKDLTGQLLIGHATSVCGPKERKRDFNANIFTRSR